jgi:hypothetical protein
MPITEILMPETIAPVLIIGEKRDRFRRHVENTAQRFLRHYKSGSMNSEGLLVGARGFEPPTSRSRTVRATKLRYAPYRNQPYRNNKGPALNKSSRQHGTASDKLF